MLSGQESCRLVLGPHPEAHPRPSRPTAGAPEPLFSLSVPSTPGILVSTLQSRKPRLKVSPPSQD